MSKWLVNGLIPKGHAVLLLGQPHSMKSWVIEQLGLSIASGEKFLSAFEVEQGSVILIDEDTPSDTLDERLDKLATGMSVSLSSLSFSKRSMQGFFLINNTDMNNLITDIKSMNPPVLVIIDSLSIVMGSWNQNSTRDTIKAAERWNEIKRAGATLLLTHHMSLKKQGSYKEWDFTGQSMGNTQLIARCDTAIGLWRIPPETPTRAIVKAKPRRTALTATEPFVVQLQEPESKSWAYLSLIEEIPNQPSEVARQVFPLFYRDRMENATVDEVIQIVNKDYSDNAVREALHELADEGALVRDKERKGKAHRHRYSLNPEFENPWSPTTSYWDELHQY